MSTFTIRATSRRAPRTPFCSVCKKAGKTESEYTSHFVRDSPGPQGRIVCPTLLSTECRYCHDLGHTKTHCPKLIFKAENEKKRERVRYMNEKKQRAESRLRALVSKTEEPTLAFKMGRSVVLVPIKGAKNRRSLVSKTFKAEGTFAALYDSDEEDHSTRYVEPMVSVVTPAPITGRWRAGTGFAGKAALKPAAPEPKSEPFREMVSISPNDKTLEIAEFEKDTWVKKSWADMADDEDRETDSDEEEEIDSFGRPLNDNSAW